MRRSVRSALTAAAAGAALAAAATITVTPALADPAPAAGGPATSPPATVRLVTGDAVGLRTVGGRTAVTVAPAAHSGLGAALSRWTLGGHAYVVPASARPYLGTVLDPELFDVSTAPADTGRVGVTLAYAAGSRPAVPGFTATSTTTTGAQGYLDASGTAAFGAALAQAATRAAGTAPSTLFGVTRIARSDTPPVVTPQFPQITVVVKATDAAGAPANGTVGLVNLDDPRRFGGFLFLANGQARASVPKGNYALIADLFGYDVTSNTYSDSLVSLPDVTVRTDFQRIVVDGATATAVPTVQTPRPGGLVSLTVDYERLVDGVETLGFSDGSGPGGTVRIAPAPAPRTGQVELLTTWALQSTDARGAPYRYDLAFEQSGAITADQSHVVAASQLATLTSRYGTDGVTQEPIFGRVPVYPFQSFIFSFLDPQSGPMLRTEYLTAPPAAEWYDTYVAVPRFDDPFNGFTSDGLRVHPAGSVATVSWLQGPLAPGVVSPAPGDTAFLSTSCRTDHRLSLALAPFTDSTPGHVGSFDSYDPSVPVETFTLTRGTTVVAQGDGTTGGSFAVPAGAATYTATVETFGGNAGFLHPSHAVTTLTFRSDATGGAPLPDGWSCLVDGRTTTTARVLPLLLATVPLPTDLFDVMPLGTNTFTFGVAPQAGAPAATVEDVTMAVSVDAGATFTAVPVTALGGNRFRAAITHTRADAGRFVTWRLTGRTAAGSAITETVDNAYTVAGS